MIKVLKSPKTVKIEFIHFALSGVVGFVVDAGIVFSLTRYLFWNPMFAQFLAFTIAVTVTWLISRNVIFTQKASINWFREWAHYVAANSIGAIVNNGIYAALVINIELFYARPELAVAVGSIAGLGFNFTATKAWVFRSR